MNRTEFMNQLEIFLQNISLAEKEEVLQYYNDYFDDAGAENEQSVIEALGNPARVAEDIRRELSENQGTKSTTAAERAVVEYGKADIDEETGELPVAEAADGHMVELSMTASGIKKSADTAGCGSSGPGRPGFPEGNSGSGGSGGFGGSPGAGGSSGSSGKGGSSGGMNVLISILVVFASPFILGLLSIMFGLLVMWFALILSFGVVVLSMFIVLFALLVVGGMCIPVDPLVGLALIGGGLICGGLGILFLMPTVAMAGIATPAIFRGIGHMFRFGKKRAIT